MKDSRSSRLRAVQLLLDAVDIWSDNGSIWANLWSVCSSLSLGRMDSESWRIQLRILPDMKARASTHSDTSAPFQAHTSECQRRTSLQESYLILSTLNCQTAFWLTWPAFDPGTSLLFLSCSTKVKGRKKYMRNAGLWKECKYI
jgi:hypothetical protein